MINDDISPMDTAISLAKIAAEHDEVPVGAVITDKNGNIIARAENRMVRDRQSIAHAELLAIRSAMEVSGSDRLTAYDLWVTLEPCAMCAGAIAHSRLRRLYFGAYDKKSGAVEHGPRIFSQSVIHHRPEIYGGIRQRICEEMMTAFFAKKR